MAGLHWTKLKSCIKLLAELTLTSSKVPKEIFLKLGSVKYSGKSIGDDIRVEIETMGERVVVDKQIKRGTTKRINKDIVRFTVDQNSLTLPITVRIIEKDIVFNDVGAKKVKIKVDLSNQGSQKSTHRVEVFEKRWKYKKPKALFDVTFEVLASDIFRYIEEMDEGFLLVKNEADKKKSLPAFLKVKYNRRENEREYFTLLEGVLQGKTFSVKAKSGGSSRLIEGNPYTGPVHMTYSKSAKKLTVKGRKYKIIEDPANSWRKGVYDVEIPDHPHMMPEDYLNKSSKAKVWFHIGHDHRDEVAKERYLHTGTMTAGCMTMIELEKWDEIYKILIKARKGDSMSVGTVEIID